MMGAVQGDTGECASNKLLERNTRVCAKPLPVQTGRGRR